MSSQTELLTKAQKVKKILNGLDVGYSGAAQFDSLVSPDPFPIGEEAIQALEKRGALFKEWMQITNNLYIKSLTDPDLIWISRLIEVSSPPEVIEQNRRIYSNGSVRTPLFARVDQPTIDKAVELQIPGSGWGYFLAYAYAYDHPNVIGKDFLIEFADQVKTLTGKQNPRVVHLLHKEDRFGKEAAYFASEMRKVGIDFSISVQKIPEDIKSYDMVIRHYFEELAQYQNWEQLIDLYLNGQIEIEPPPSLITDQKLNTMLPFHPVTRGYYSDEIRELFPVTYLIEPDSLYSFNLNGEWRTLNNDDVIRLTKKQRRLVLKYAGLDPGRRSGGKEVWNLYSMSQKKTATLINMALSDYQQSGQPWLIQELIREKYTTTFMGPDGQINTQDLSARFMPFFAFPLNDELPKLLSLAVHLRNFWKVHGQKDTVSTIVMSQNGRSTN